jgi:hypothetical protein
LTPLFDDVRAIQTVNGQEIRSFEIRSFEIRSFEIRSFEIRSFEIRSFEIRSSGPAARRGTSADRRPRPRNPADLTSAANGRRRFMNKTRAAVAVAFTVVLAAMSLTSCATPGPTFHFVGIIDPVSTSSFDEMYAGDYTIAADNPTNAADLRWVISWGLIEEAPGTFPVKAVDGVASVPVTFEADPNPYPYPRYYQICLSSIAQPLAQTCKTIKVGPAGLWDRDPAYLALNAADGKPYELQLDESGRTLHLELLDGTTPVLTTDATLLSPFTAEFTLAGGAKGRTSWRDWHSVDVTFPPSILGGYTITFFRQQVFDDLVP